MQIEELTRKITALAGHWASVSALGTFLLYLAGYLSLRFHLTALGIPSDLSVLDERYFFEGANFLIYLAVALTNAVLLAMVLALLAFLLTKILPEGASLAVKSWWQRSRAWWGASGRLASAGIVLSVLLIQTVLKQSFHFKNLLLRERLPRPDWLRLILLESEKAISLSVYFTGLIAVVAVTTGLLLAARRQPRKTEAVRLRIALLTLLVLFEWALLPVNYGILSAGREAPRVESPVCGANAWLVWEESETLTFLLQQQPAESEPTGRSLLTLPREKVERLQILNREPLLHALFAKKASR